MNLRQRGYLTEMAALPSLKQLQRKGNKKPASQRELQNARKRALRMKTPMEAREAATFAWEMMEKAQIIQVFLDREAELINPKLPIAKPLFMDSKRIKWSQLNKYEISGAIKWLGGSKTKPQLETLLKQAKAANKKKPTQDLKIKIKVHEEALKTWAATHKMWRASANKTWMNFGG